MSCLLSVQQITTFPYWASPQTTAKPSASPVWVRKLPEQSAGPEVADTKRKRYTPGAKFYLHIDSPFKRSYCYWITEFFKSLLWNTFCWIYLQYEFSSLQTAHSWKLWTLNKLEYYSKVEGRFKYQICTSVY